MRIKDICETLGVSRNGLYWMLENNDMQGHARRKPSGRWIIDDTAVEMLKDIRKKSRKVIVEIAPADPHADATIRGMQLEITRLKQQLEIMKLKHDQGVYLRNSIEDIANESEELDISAKRELLRLVNCFDKETKDSVVLKALKGKKFQA